MSGGQQTPESASGRRPLPIRSTEKLGRSRFIPPNLYLIAEKYSTPKTATTCPTRPLMALSVAHPEKINDLISAIRPEPDWPGKNHVPLLLLQNLKSIRLRPPLQDDLRSFVEPPA